MDDITFLGDTKSHTPPEPVSGDEIKVFWAFLYTMACPGWGESYTGNQKRSVFFYILLAVTFILFCWSTWNLGGSFTSLMREHQDLFSKGLTDEVMDFLVFPILFFIIGAGGLYVTWMSSILSAIDSAMEKRASDGLAPERSIFWTIVMTRICPGAGQVYGGKKELGWVLCGVSLLGTALTLLAFPDFFGAVKDVFTGGGCISAGAIASVDVLLGNVSKIKTYLTFSFGALLSQLVFFYACWDCAGIFSKDFLKEGETGMSPYVRAVLLFTWGYLCPGSAQVLSGREKQGTGIILAIGGFSLLLALLLEAGLMPREKADTIMMIPALISWGAIIEAPIRLLVAEKMNNQSTS